MRLRMTNDCTYGSEVSRMWNVGTDEAQTFGHTASLTIKSQPRAVENRAVSTDLSPDAPRYIEMS